MAGGIEQRSLFPSTPEHKMSVRDRERVARAIVKQFAEEHYDWRSFVRGLHLLFDALENRTHPQIAELALQYVQEYISLQGGLVCKQPLPFFGQDDEEIKVEAAAFKAQIDALRPALTRTRVLSKVPRDLLTFIHYFSSRLIQSLEKGAYFSTSPILVHPAAPHEDSAAVEGFAAISTALNHEISPEQTSDFSAMNLVGRVLDTIQSVSSSREFNHVSDVYTMNLGGVNLEQLVQAESQHEFNYLAVQFLAHVPKGNVFWHGIRDRLFFFMLNFGAAGNRENLAHPQWIERVLCFFEWIAAELYRPGYTEEPANPEFTRLFTMLLRDSALDSHPFFAAAVTYSARDAAMTRSFFNREQSETAVEDESEALRIARVHLSPLQVRTKLYVPDVLVLGMMRDEAVQRDILQRFTSQREGCQLFLAGMQRALEEDYRITRTRVITQMFDRIVGDEFLTSLASHRSEIHQTTDYMLRDELLRRVDSWPSPELVHRVVFRGETSVPSMLGVESVQFLTLADSGRPVYFILRTAQRGVRIDGFLTLGGDCILQHLLREELDPTLLELLKHTVVATFRDLVVRQRRHSIGSHNEALIGDTEYSEPVGEQDEHTGVFDGTTLSLPLIRQVGELAGFDEEVTYSDDLIASVEAVLEESSAQRGRRRPARIPMYRRRVPYGQAYKEACEAYVVHNGGLREYTKLLRLRRLVHRVSRTKLENLPTGYELETVVDPQTQEVVYIETWVKPHWNPRVAEGDTLPEMYERVYASDFSALSFMEEIVTLPA